MVGRATAGGRPCEGPGAGLPGVAGTVEWQREVRAEGTGQVIQGSGWSAQRGLGFCLEGWGQRWDSSLGCSLATPGGSGENELCSETDWPVCS